MNRITRTSTIEDCPEPYGIKSGVVLGVIFGIGLAYPLIRSLLPKLDFPNYTHIGQYFVTWATGIWFWVRYHFTESATTRVKGFPSIGCTILIMMIGLVCFPLSEFWFWYVPHAIVLTLAVEKDIEVMVFQRRLARSSKKGSVRKWKTAMLALYEWYAIIRDLSMAAWWGIYGVICFHYGLRSDIGVLLFGIPYVFCVVAWCTIKVKMHNIELSGIE